MLMTDRLSALVQVSSQEFTEQDLQAQRLIHGIFVSIQKYSHFLSVMISAVLTEIMLLTVISIRMKKMFVQMVSGRNTSKHSLNHSQQKRQEHILTQSQAFQLVLTHSSHSVTTLKEHARAVFPISQSQAVQSVMMLLLIVVINTELQWHSQECVYSTTNF